MTHELLARVADENEIAARVDWFESLPPSVVRRFDGTLVRFGRAIGLMLPKTCTAFFNRVIGLGVFEPASVQLVRRIVESYGRLNTAFMVHVSPYARPASLSEWLIEAGLRPYGQWIVGFRFARAMVALSTDLRIARIDETFSRAFGETMCVASEMPEDWAPLFSATVGRRNWHHYLAFDGDTPVATGSWFENGSCAWMGNSATLPAYRGRGAHGALTHARLEDLRMAGCKVSTGEVQRPATHSPSQSWSNHRRTGSRPAYVRSNYGVPPTIGRDILEPHQQSSRPARRQ